VPTSSHKYGRLILPALLLLFLFPVGLKAQKKTGLPVDIVICVDLSSSSNGLIDQLRNHIWDYWYFFSRCTPQPDYRIAVVTYARFSYGKQNGYTRVLQDLGTDFEKLSSILSKIPSKIERGDQYVGSALNTCLKKISWSKDPQAVKMVFLVGNGDVTTGPDDIDLVLNKLIAQNIIVNTVYCTVPGEKKAISGWQKIAQKAGGKIATISIRNLYFDRLNGFDLKKFRALNRRFNNTYLYFGADGRKRRRRMEDVDNFVYIRNTEGYRFRSLYKMSDDYQKSNASWDLVDLYSKNPIGFMNVDRATMIDTCRKMNDDKLKAYIIYKKYERRKLSGLMADMITDKELKDREEGKVVVKNMATLDIVTLKLIRDALIEKSCACTIK
jgi:hypothetical protein